MNRIPLYLFIYLILFTPFAQADWSNTLDSALLNGGGYAVDDNGKVLYAHRADEPFIPASTIKVATAACAMATLGADYRFMTDFYLTPEKILIMKGYGDPFLISEELLLIAKNLKQAGLNNITGIIVDDTAFENDIELDGVSSSNNPYDALNGAVIANFNTIFVVKTANGVQSAEPQTPITPIAKQLAQKIGSGKQRINLGKDHATGARYAGELLAEFLKQEGVIVGGEVTRGATPNDAKGFYQHKSSKTITDVVTGLLEYSTNFMANQLFLFMGAKVQGAPATQAKGVRVLKDFLSETVGWQDFEIAEGSGLSRHNRVTAKHMMRLLEYFEPHADLLPLKQGLFRAKTGTLTGVSSLIGYFKLNSGKRVKFVLMVNDAVGYEYKFRVAKILYNGLNSGP